ncbi:MAG: hypothetical protein M1536_07090 [Firmicutes bacterium]|nr:hypothetical protein [Bacillota bacterium]
MTKRNIISIIIAIFLYLLFCFPADTVNSSPRRGEGKGEGAVIAREEVPKQSQFKIKLITGREINKNPVVIKTKSPQIFFSGRTGLKVYTSLSTVNTAVKTDESVLLGTKGGIVKYSGRAGSWDVLTTLDGLSANNVTDIAEIGETIWFGTAPGEMGASNWGGLTWIEKHDNSLHRLSKKGGLLSSRITALFQDGDSLYAGTDRGLNIIDVFERKVETLPDEKNYPREKIQRIYGGDRYIWVIAQKKFPADLIYWFDRKTRKWNKSLSRKIFTFDSVSSLAGAEEGIWVAGYRRILPSGKGNSIHPSPRRGEGAGEGEYVFSGLLKYNAAKKKKTFYTLPSGFFTSQCFIFSRGGNLNLWTDRGFGYLSNGVLKFYVNPKGRDPDKDFLKCLGYISRIYDDNDFWIPYKNGTAHYINGNWDVWKFSDTPSSDYLLSIASDSKGLWIGGEEGKIDRFLLNGEKWLHYQLPGKSGGANLRVEEIFFAGKGRLFARCFDYNSRYRLFYVFNFKKGKWEAAGKISSGKKNAGKPLPASIKDILKGFKFEADLKYSKYVEDKDYIWITTYGSGLLRVDKRLPILGIN